jgi:hypothetical protein
MDQFPFILVYEIRSEAIEFVAIAHGRRMPGYWLARVRPPPSPST